MEIFIFKYLKLRLYAVLSREKFSIDMDGRIKVVAKLQETDQNTVPRLFPQSFS